MTKLEKVIKELRWLQFNFPWQDNPENDAGKMSNAIHKYTGDALELLKEQETKPVLSLHIMRGFAKYIGRCPNCKQEILEIHNKSFCGFCGQAVKWE